MYLQCLCKLAIISCTINWEVKVAQLQEKL
uniref:Uncharacterized protein n=1 Tax=Rhizophora mucronata TaxID=61149 RepID=A0A2P2QZQ3_RHIMU